MAKFYETLRLEQTGTVLFATIDAPPMNMLGPELVRDLVSLIETLDKGEPYKVVVFKSADPDYFISHVDVTKIAAYREEAAKLTGEASIALLFRRLSETKAVTIAQIEGRVRGAGSEFHLELRRAVRRPGGRNLLPDGARFRADPGWRRGPTLGPVAWSRPGLRGHAERGRLRRRFG